jgi:hypothetical protein
MEQELARQGIPCVPPVDHQRRRTWSEIGDVLMKRRELVGYGLARKFEQSTSEPTFGTLKATPFT